jgi:uracil-DNA glycosylase
MAVMTTAFITRLLVAHWRATSPPHDASVTDTLQAIRQHQARLRDCARCPGMVGPVVTGAAVASPVLLIGQAPGAREGAAGRPFAWTAGKTLFRWLAGIGLDEAAFRQRVYMAAVCRCFPGKAAQGGDRVPAPDEIANCSPWLDEEIRLLRPRLLIPVGRLAIAQFIPVVRLSEVIGERLEVRRGTWTGDLIALPHPSGASTWHRTEPGRSLLERALRLIAEHPAWQGLLP